MTLYGIIQELIWVIFYYQVVQIYISWANTDIAPIRQLVGVERISLISPSNSTDVSYSYQLWDVLTNCDYLHACVTLYDTQVSFVVTAEQMMLYDTKWYIPTTEYKVYVGGQQPNQQTTAPSNILDGSFTVQA